VRSLASCCALLILLLGDCKQVTCVVQLLRVVSTLLLLLLQPAGVTQVASPPAMVARPSGATAAVDPATATSHAHTPRTAARGATCTGECAGDAQQLPAMRLTGWRCCWGDVVRQPHVVASTHCQQLIVLQPASAYVALHQAFQMQQTPCHGSCFWGCRNLSPVDIVRLPAQYRECTHHRRKQQLYVTNCAHPTCCSESSSASPCLLSVGCSDCLFFAATAPAMSSTAPAALRHAQEEPPAPSSLPVSAMIRSFVLSLQPLAC
jgi:hypothetical protein